MLFIDELHTLVGAGAAEGAIDAANILKPPLARGELQCIGATTLDEYRKYIERDAALERRFQPVMVEEPTLEQTIDILLGIRRATRSTTGSGSRTRPLQAAADLSHPLHHRPLPARQGDRPDRRGGQPRAPAPRVERPPELKEAQKELDRVAKEKEAAINDQEYEVRGQAARRRGAGQENIDELRNDVADARSPGNVPMVDEEDIAEVVAMWTGIPVTRIAQEESERLLHMEEALHKRVIGQDEAIDTISKAVRRARAGLKDPKRPIGSFIFLGPTGVGKTELAKALAEFMFGSEDTLIKIDMSEFMERHNVGAAGRRTSRLRRLRRGRPADRGGPPQELLRRPARRDREGASGGVQHPAADPGGRAPDGRQGPPGRLPQHGHHHDQQRRREVTAQGHVSSASVRSRRTPRSRSAGSTTG